MMATSSVSKQLGVVQGGTAMSMREREDELFERWKRERNTRHFAKDGLVCEEEYLKSARRLLFVLKDVNSQEEYDLRDYLANHEKKPDGHTWNNVARWAYGIMHLEQDLPWEEVDRQGKDPVPVLRQVCAMNLKKSPGASESNGSELGAAAQEDHGFLREQFRLYLDDAPYAPQIILACGDGVADLVRNVVRPGALGNVRTTTCGVRFWEADSGWFLIECRHPNRTKGDKPVYDKLMCSVREILRIDMRGPAGT